MTQHDLAPSRRRRHAHLLAAAAGMIGQCAQAASAVYQPVAADPTSEVRINGVPLIALPALLGDALERAILHDDEQWPADEQADASAVAATAARLRVLAEAEAALATPQPTGPDTVPLPSPAQAAALDLASSGTQLVAALHDGGPPALVEALGDLAAAGEIAPGAALADAMQTVLLAARLCVIDGARIARIDPSGAAEHALVATRHLTAVVQLASVDTEVVGIA